MQSMDITFGALGLILGFFVSTGGIYLWLEHQAVIGEAGIVIFPVAIGIVIFSTLVGAKLGSRFGGLSQVHQKIILRRALYFFLSISAVGVVWQGSIDFYIQRTINKLSSLSEKESEDLLFSTSSRKIRDAILSIGNLSQRTLGAQYESGGPREKQLVIMNSKASCDLLFKFNQFRNTQAWRLATLDIPALSQEDQNRIEKCINKLK
jgi:hypothetical protein